MTSVNKTNETMTLFLIETFKYKSRESCFRLGAVAPIASNLSSREDDASSMSSSIGRYGPLLPAADGLRCALLILDPFHFEHPESVIISPLHPFMKITPRKKKFLQKVNSIYV